MPDKSRRFVPASGNKRSSLVLAALGLSALGAAWYLSNRSRRQAISFAGHVVVITGGSRGLGLELARAFGAEGATVAICARSESELTRALHDLAARGCEAFGMLCDVRDTEQCRRFIESVTDRYGGLDVLINNAGIIQVGPLACMTRADFEDSLETHFWGPYSMIHEAIPHLTASTVASIVNVASIGGEVAVPHLAPYCAGKFALVGFSEGISAELRSLGIHVTTVCPGLMRTGSPRNAEFKGNHQAEYAWFSISDSMPGITIDSRVAARRILQAVRNREAYLRLSLPARVAPLMKGFAPQFVSRLLRFAQAWLPRAPEQRSSRSQKGYESYSNWSPSLLTTLNESAARRNNETTCRPRQH